MLQRTLPAGFIAPCLPTRTDKLPSGGHWLHEIKHDGFRIAMAAFAESWTKKAHVCPKKQQLTPGPSRGAIFDCDKPDFILKNGPWKGRKLYDLFKATEPPRE